MKLNGACMPKAYACQSPENCENYSRSVGLTQKHGAGAGDSTCPR